jgi:RING finger protein 113A
MDEPEVLFKKRGTKKAAFRKRPAVPPPASDSDYSSSEQEDGRRVKRRKKTGGVIAVTTTTAKTNLEDLEAPKYTADRSAQIDSVNDATKQANWFDEGKEDDLSAKNLLGNSRKAVAAQPNGVYKGAAGYSNFIQTNPDRMTSKATQIGPIKAPTNIRTITVTDFAPDVCKDYKQTGHCGFGDSCKFLHAREDYKQGWQLDKEWESVTKGKKLGGKVVSNRNKNNADEPMDSDEDDEMLEGIPFACIICKGPYKNPIVTKCGHYFCEKCAMGRYRKSPSCVACGAGTGGIFNAAKNLRRLLDKKKKKARVRKERAREKGEEVSEDEEDGDGEEGG